MAAASEPLIDHGIRAQQAAEEHLTACWEALDESDEGAEDVQWPDLAAPFCGCQTCEIREVLHASWPHLREAARAELLEEGTHV